MNPNPSEVPSSAFDSENMVLYWRVYGTILSLFSVLNLVRLCCQCGRRSCKSKENRPSNDSQQWLVTLPLLVEQETKPRGWNLSSWSHIRVGNESKKLLCNRTAEREGAAETRRLQTQWCLWAMFTFTKGKMCFEFHFGDLQVCSRGMWHKDGGETLLLSILRLKKTLYDQLLMISWNDIMLTAWF